MKHFREYMLLLAVLAISAPGLAAAMFVVDDYSIPFGPPDGEDFLLRSSRGNRMPIAIDGNRTAVINNYFGSMRLIPPTLPGNPGRLLFYAADVDVSFKLDYAYADLDLSSANLFFFSATVYEGNPSFLIRVNDGLNSSAELLDLSVSGTYVIDFNEFVGIDFSSIDSITLESVTTMSSGSPLFEIGPVSANTVPVPATIWLLGGGIAAFAAFRKRVKQYE